MKMFKVNMTRALVELASKPIRSKEHVIMLLLEAIPLFVYGDIVQQPSSDFVILRIDKMKRIFFVLENKIFSFNFPFNAEVPEGSSNPIIYDAITDFVMDAVNLAAIKSIFEEILYDNKHKAILDYDSDIMRIMESFDLQPEKDRIWGILKGLVIFESGYLRYDYDEQHQNGRLHPLNHLDINYSSEATFKIGLNNAIDSDSLIDILDITTNSYFISE